jgi:Rha family phage regulatory protein
MNELVQKPLTLDSREVAEMVGKDHAHLIRDIETYIGYMGQNPELDSDEFFQKGGYVAGTGKEYKKYDVTKKGCEFIANKLTGQRGTEFTATYINRFHEMEQALSGKSKVIPELKAREIEARLKNARVRESNAYLKIADKPGIPESYKRVLYSYASAALAGKPLLPLPETEKAYSATDIAEMAGISANMVGKISNKYNLKTDEYGSWAWDKSRSSAKEVQSFRYNQKGMETLLQKIKEAMA